MSYEPYLPQNSFPSSDWPGDINSTQEEQAQTHNVESISAASGRRGIQLGDLSDPNLQYNARTRQGEPIYFDSQPWHLSDTLELYEGETHDKKLLPEERKTNMSQASNRSRHYHANEVLDENNPSSFILKPIGGTSWSTANARGPKYRLNYERSDLIPDSWEDRATQFSPATSTFTNSPNVSEEFLSDSRQPETLSPAGDAPWSPFRMRNVTGDGSSTPYPYLSPDEGIWWAQHSIPAALESITDLDTISASESRHGNDDETISSWANTGPGAHTASNILSATETATSRSSMLLAPNHSSDYHPILESTRASSHPSSTISEVPELLYCDHCGNAFRGRYRKGNLARHRREKHRGSPVTYTCEEEDCNRVFMRSDAKLKHMRKFHLGRVKQDNVTMLETRLYDQSAGLDSPQDALGSSPYLCEESGCSRSYTRRAELLRHQRSHQSESERPYKCSTCEQSFLYPKDLHRHESTHEGATKPMYYCEVPLCPSGPGGSDFSRLDNLQRHMRQSHPGLA